jgi:hypothetical protein
VGHVPDKPLVIEPSPAKWRELLAAQPALPPDQRHLRRQLGLPDDRPVILSGHQAEFWHPGILAKYLALSAAGSSLSAAIAWLVVDQDANDPSRIRYPTRREDGTLASGLWRADPAAGATRLTTGSRPAVHPAALPPDLPDVHRAGESVARGLAAIRESLLSHAAQPSMARQFAAAIGDLASSLCPRIPLIRALELSRTDAFAAVIERIRADASACARSYNAAAARHPRSRIRPLDDGPDPEVPLWRLESGQRRPARASDLGGGQGSLAPRALLMTGLLRLGACDLFIHGTGGGGVEADAGYEAVTDDWLGAWLGERPRAAVAIATATLRLPLDPDAARDLGRIERARSAAHRARHDPALLGDAPGAAAKRSLIAQIDQAKLAGADARPRYREMHAMLAGIRDRHADSLDRLEAESVAASERLAQAHIAADRTWPFPLYPDAMLRTLKADIDAVFSL